MDRERIRAGLYVCQAWSAPPLVWSNWLMRAGWGTLALLALPPLSIALVVGVALMASVFPAWFPGWLAQIPGAPERTNTNVVNPQIWLFLVPALLWTAALLVRRNRCAMKITQEAEANRIVFLDSLVAGGVIGRPEVLIYPEEGRPQESPVCIPFLEIPEELPPNRDPDERHLVRAAAQCLLLEYAYDIPVDIGLLEFRNRAVSFVMTDFARERTEGVLEQIRRLQMHNN
jgi:hypothetical protein